jgi:hypothetical protein
MIRNHHSRTLQAGAGQMGGLIDGLASPQDQLWPIQHWPPMHFDRPLQVGAVGGHADIGYEISAYTPGQRIEFRFTAPTGFLGTHRIFIEPIDATHCTLHHFLEVQPEGSAKLTWLMIRPMHDALLEDALDNAERWTGHEPHQPAKWSAYVQFLRLMHQLMVQIRGDNKTLENT